MNHLLNHRDGSTPVDPDQMQGLKFKHVKTMGELDELEDLNIQSGIEWLHNQKKQNFLSSEFLCKLHKKLFGNVWRWAGTYRKVNVNLSKTSPELIQIQLIEFFEDVKLWIQSGKMSWDEIAAEFHHRLVSIHPFHDL